MKHQAIIAIALTLCGSNTYANTYTDSYSNELVARYTTIQESGSTDHSYKSIGAAHFFSPVQYNSHTPYAKTAFVQETGGIGIIYTKAESEGYVKELDEDIWFLTSKLYVPKTPFNIEFNAIKSTNKDNSSPSNQEYSYTDWGLTAGWKPNQYLEVSTSYWHDNDYEINLDVSYLAKLANNRHIDLEFNFEKAPDNDGKNYYAFSADYFIQIETSLGLFISEQYETAYGARFHHFFTKKLHGELSLVKEKDEDVYSLTLAYRI